MQAESLILSKMKKPNFLALSSNLHPPSKVFVPWRSQNGTEQSRCGLTTAKQSGIIITLDLMAAFLAIQSNMSLAFFDARLLYNIRSTHCPSGSQDLLCRTALFPVSLLHGQLNQISFQSSEFLSLAIDLRMLDTNKILETLAGISVDFDHAKIRFWGFFQKYI